MCTSGVPDYHDWNSATVPGSRLTLYCTKCGEDAKRIHLPCTADGRLRAQDRDADIAYLYAAYNLVRFYSIVAECIENVPAFNVLSSIFERIRTGGGS